MPTLIREVFVRETTPSSSDDGGLQSLSREVIIGQVHRGDVSPTSRSCDLFAQKPHAKPLMLSPTVDFQKRMDERWQCPPPPCVRRIPMIINGNAAVFDRQDLVDLSSGVTVIGTVNSKAVAKNQGSFDYGTGGSIEYRHQVEHDGKDAKVRIASREKQGAEEGYRRHYIKEEDKSNEEAASLALKVKLAQGKRSQIEREELEAEDLGAEEKQLTDEARPQRGAKAKGGRPIKENQADAVMTEAVDAKSTQTEQFAKEDETCAAATEVKQQSEEAERRCQVQGKSRLRKKKETRSSSEDSATQGREKIRKVYTNHQTLTAKHDISALSSFATKKQSTRPSSLAKKLLKPRFEVNDKVFAPWWPNTKRKSQPSWYSGVITGYNIVKTAGKYGPTRHYTVRFDDDNQELQGIEEAYVFSLEDYNLSMLGQKGGSGRTRWIGVKNITDKNSSDLWANVVGWYEASIDGEIHSFSRLSDALRTFDANVIAKKGDKVKKSELNLPNEVVHKSNRSK
ncbi:hypothetical protein ACHAW6_013030 [Cyclotella cf. meneghiniana]